jgi:hypothetical protein
VTFAITLQTDSQPLTKLFHVKHSISLIEQIEIIIQTVSREIFNKLIGQIEIIIQTVSRETCNKLNWIN